MDDITINFEPALYEIELHYGATDNNGHYTIMYGSRELKIQEPRLQFHNATALTIGEIGDILKGTKSIKSIRGQFRL